MMKKLLLLSAFTIVTYFLFGQNPIIDFQKINETNGNFMSSLDVEDYFGFSCDSIGDLNKDGTCDIIVGAWGDDDGGTDKGSVYILFLNPDGTVKSEQKISDLEGNFAGVLDNGDIFGRSVSSMGDLNNDGIVDVAVGAEYDSDAGLYHGAFYLLFLDTTGQVQSYNKINEDDLGVSLSGSPVFGSDIANMGDLNGDGVVDLAVGSRRDSDGGSERGAVWILFLNSDGNVLSTQKISDTEGGLTASLGSNDYFGSSLANIGDLNNDGVNDLAVGAYRDDDGGSDYGALYILFLNSNGTVKSEQKISATEGNFSGNLNTNSLFGVSVATVGDINNDQNMDLIVGAAGDNTNGSYSGGFFIINLNSNGTVNSHQFYTEGVNGFTGDITNNDRFGNAVASIGKIGDHFSFIAGAKGDSDNGWSKGALWILKIEGDIISNTQTFNEKIKHPFPNPVNNRLYIDGQSTYDEITLRNVYGQILISKETYEDYLDMRGLKNGIYILNINIKGETLTYKIIKQ